MLPPLARAPARAPCGIARTFQTPRIVGAASVLENVMIGGTIDGKGTFVESLLVAAAPSTRRGACCARPRCWRLTAVGLEQLAAVRADRLQHSELRFVEIARALMLRPAFLLLDEPAAGLSAEEIRRLGALIKAISRAGTGVLLVEHHADLIFDICDHVTVLNLGKMLAAGTPAEIRSHREVVSAYLGALTRCCDVAGLSTGYGKIGVLHGIDLTVGAGEVVALLGPNGAGKTTLLRAVSGLLPWSGSVQFAGQRPHRRRSARNREGRARACDRGASGVHATDRARQPAAGRLRPAARRARGAGRGGARPSSPRSPPSATSAPARCPAASSRCWRSRKGWCDGRGC